MTTMDLAPAGVAAGDFRHAMGYFATGVTVVTSVGSSGEPVGTTASAVSSLSLDPPLILVCFDRSSATLEAPRWTRRRLASIVAVPDPIHAPEEMPCPRCRS